MIINGNDIIKLPKCDVIVIGSGPAGLAVSTRLAANDVSVLIIEAGGLSPTDQSQQFYDGENTGIDYPLASSRSRAFGGSSNCWGGWCRRLEQIEFVKRPWINYSKWPIAANLEEKYYSDAAVFLGIEGKNYDPSYWAMQCGQPPNSIFDDSKTFESRVWQIAVSKNLGKDLLETIDQSKKITLVYNCSLTSLIHEGSLIRSIQCRTSNGKSINASSDKYVLAMGALENARCLLASGLQDVIGSRWLGKGFMEHPARINGLRLYTYSNTRQYMEYSGGRTYEPTGKGFRIAFGFGLTNNSQITNKVTGFWGVFSDKIKKISQAEELEATFLLSSQGIKKNGNVVAYDITWAIEQAPQIESAVFISKDKDSLGMNKLKLNWVVSDLDVKTANYSMKSLATDLLKRKIGVVRKIKGLTILDRDLDYGHHHLGTVRMGSCPRDGVVDHNCRVFGLDNLYCAGSGIFPTSAATNPTYGLTAFSFRLAEHLKM